MYGQKSTKDHDNYLERLLNSEDEKLKAYTTNKDVRVLNRLKWRKHQFVVYNLGFPSFNNWDLPSIISIIVKLSS